MTQGPVLWRFIRRTVEGVQRPPVFEADDGHHYVLKLDNHDEDFPAAELVAAGLASPLGVAIPPYAVLTVPDELLELCEAVGDPDHAEFAESFRRRGGLCFGSRYLNGAVEKWQEAMRHRIPDAEAFLGRLLVFDAFIENGDRSAAHNPNLLATGGGLFAIDHGQALPSVQGIVGKRFPFNFASHIAWRAIEERPDLLIEPTATLRTLPDATIDGAVDAVPPSLWSAPDRADLCRADLRRRRDELPATLDALREKLS